uniref:U3 small nucleolar RNA-associated protein 25 homolog n=1 Tax=Plectus sambesii TaxID=2011161 RepID=A0A914VXT7_9BILA
MYTVFVQMPENGLKRKVKKASPKSAKLPKVSEVEEEDDECIEEAEDNTSEDFFTTHYCQDLDDVEATRLLGADVATNSELRLPAMGPAVLLNRTNQSAQLNPLTDWKSYEALGLRKTLRDNIGDPLSDEQNDFYQLLSRYKDVLLPRGDSKEEMREVYCLHALNHALRTRRLVMQHSARLRELKESGQLDDAAVEKFRDQGLARPKVLILCPFRKTAMQIVDIMTRLLFGSGSKKLVTNRKRFVKEFGGAGNDVSHRKDVDDDYKELMSGNVDDCFRVGLGIAKKSLKLYTDFYQADILLASPVGLRMVVGDEDEKHHEHDFLASIEVLIMDQTDVFLMQNWQHVLHLFDNLHRQPKEAHDVDLTRVRLWSLNGWAKLYRQTVVLADVAVPELRSLFTRYCRNFAGAVYFKPRIEPNGALDRIEPHLSQAFHRFDIVDVATEPDARFDYFVRKVLPHYKDGTLAGTLVFIPSYYDFVRVRNYLKRETASFVQLSEYASNTKVARARDLFFHAKKPMLLLTERFHFYRRYRLKGVKHLIFYQLPTYPQFYAEVSNFLLEPSLHGVDDSVATCTVMYSKLDAMRLANVIGQQHAAQLVGSDKQMHLVVTGQSE